MIAILWTLAFLGESQYYIQRKFKITNGLLKSICRPFVCQSNVTYFSAAFALKKER
jgi:hypothetical protein